VVGEVKGVGERVVRFACRPTARSTIKLLSSSSSSRGGAECLEPLLLFLLNGL